MSEITTSTKKKNWIFIIGVLIMCVGMQLANYGTAVCVTAEVNKMGAAQFLSLIATMGSMGTMLILPVVGRLTGIVGQRNLILIGVIIQLAGRVGMIFVSDWVPYMIFYLIQSIGTGCYISSAYVNMSSVVEPHERAKFFGYIAAANAIGAIFGPMLISAMYAAGGILAKLTYIANFPLTIVGFILLFKDCSTRKTPGAGKGFDYLGLGMMVVGLGSLVLWLNLGNKMFNWISVPSLIILVIAIICLVAMVNRERKIANPAVPINMFKNPRLTSTFIGQLAAAAFSTCSTTYCVMWIRINYQGLPSSTFFNGTATLAQQVVVFLLGLFLGGWVAKKFALRFRPMGIAAMFAAIVACGILFCLRFTGTAATDDIKMLGSSFPVGMAMIYLATAIGGFTSSVSQSTFSAFWQSNTPREDIPSGQALYTFAGSGGAVIFGAIAGLVLGTSDDYTRAFIVGIGFAVMGLISALVGFRFSKEEIEAAKAKD